MELLLDMNLSPRWVDLLINPGFEAAHWSALGAYNASDSEIMAYAKANEYIHANDVNPGVIGKQVIAALQQISTDLADGALLGACRS